MEVWGNKTARSETSLSLEHLNKRRLLNEVNKEVHAVMGKFVDKPLDKHTIMSIQLELDKVEQRVLDYNLVNDIKIDKPYSETWLTMRGVSKIRGLWNRLLCKCFGGSVINPNFFHKLVGYKLDEIEYDELGYANPHQVMVGRIRTPIPMAVDLYIKPKAPVSNIKVEFKVGDKFK